MTDIQEEPRQCTCGSKYTSKWLATFAAALVCGYWAYLNHGQSGIGYFVVCLLFIW